MKRKGFLTRKECKEIADGFPRWKLRLIGVWLIFVPREALGALIQGIDIALSEAAKDGSLEEVAQILQQETAQ